MKGITRDYIRKICDDLGLTSSIDSDGDIRVVLSADEDFGHDVLVFFSVDEKGNWPEAVKVRTAEVDGRRHAYVVNTGFEPVEVDLGRFGKLRLDSYELRYLR